MLHVLLDTTVLRSDPARKKAAFQSLTRLSQGRAVQVYIPYVVQQEFLSQEKDLYQLQLNKVIASIQDLQKKNLSETTVNFLKNSVESFNQIQSELDNFSNQEFQLWCEEVRAEILPIHISHGQRVIDSYFEGGSPFKKKKSREDFPDAFIWQAICDLSENLAELYVVTSDGTVGAALQREKKIILVRTLDDFIGLKVYQQIIRELELEETKESNRTINLRRLIDLLPLNKSAFTYAIEAELISDFQGKTIKSSDILDENHEARVDYIGNIEDLEFFMEQDKYYGSSTFVIPFSVKIEARLSYFIYKADFWVLDGEKTERMSVDDWNDHVYSVDEDYSLAVEGRMSITLDSDVLEQSNLCNVDLIKVMENTEMIHIDVIDKVSVIPCSNSD